MAQYIPKSVVLAEIDRLENKLYYEPENFKDVGAKMALDSLKSFLDTLEVKEVDLIIHTVIAECCDWLVMNTNLSHDVIEGCRNLMLTVKEEQFKVQKGEGV